jgi:hypothetical protein
LLFLLSSFEGEKEDVELVTDDLDLVCLWVKERGEDWSTSANSDLRARGENWANCWEELLVTSTH